jgi:hypothetical protein
MHSFYIDDCRKSEAHISILGGFIINDDDYPNLQNNYRSVKNIYGLTPGDPAKWSPPHKPEFRKQRAIPNQNNFRRDVLNALGGAPITIVAAIVEERGRYNNRIRNYYLSASLEFLAQRFQRELSTTASTGRMILDYPGQYHELDMMKRYRDIRLNGSNYPTFSMQLPLLEESAYYSHDVASDGIQLADFIVGAIGHSIATHYYGYIQSIKSKIRKDGNKIKGVGIVLYPSNSSAADNLIANCQATP